MSSLFINAVSGINQGLSELGQQLKADEEKKYRRQLIERQLAMQDKRLASDLATAEQTRSVVGKRLASDLATAEQTRSVVGKRLASDLATAEQARSVVDKRLASTLATAEQTRSVVGKRLASDLATAEQARSIRSAEFKANAPARSLKQRQAQAALESFDPKIAANTLRNKQLLDEKITGRALQDEDLRHKAELNKLYNSLDTKDWLNAHGVDTDNIKDALLEYDTNRRYGFTPETRNLAGRSSRDGVSRSSQRDVYDPTDSAIKLLNTLKPQVGDLPNPKVDKLRSDIANLVAQNIRNDFALNDQLKGKTVEASSFLQNLNTRQVELNTEKLDAQKYATDLINGHEANHGVDLKDTSLTLPDNILPVTPELSGPPIPSQFQTPDINLNPVKSLTLEQQARASEQRVLNDKTLMHLDAMNYAQSLIPNNRSQTGRTLDPRILKMRKQFNKKFGYSRVSKHDIEAFVEDFNKNN